LRSDNGREFTAELLAEWLACERVGQAFIDRGAPQQNPDVERFNGTMRDEVLNGETFHSLLEARVVIADWVIEYNGLRPHRGLGMRHPRRLPRRLRWAASERDCPRSEWTSRKRPPGRTSAGPAGPADGRMLRATTHRVEQLQGAGHHDVPHTRGWPPSRCGHPSATVDEVNMGAPQPPRGRTLQSLRRRSLTG
jgi:hypothetical protein